MAGDNSTFEDLYGIKQTTANCELIHEQHIFNNCSILEFGGVRDRKRALSVYLINYSIESLILSADHEPCTPNDVLSGGVKNTSGSTHDDGPVVCPR